ncbi:hypothetical protein EVAR_41642_1 [Eumeta japonica]|uniref:HTH CENPB-type domain-containing protein n=1 Tax=Eumeta variegata TaxID=151549 RepID=A0A4C1X156_EUMVA|nr:hypothetical protein EVAR_41642_1 [Eumeta japonica]
MSRCKEKYEARSTSKQDQNNRPVRINYSPGDLANALKAIDTGLSLRKAAAAYNVPIATLSRKKGNPETSKQKTGPPPVFSVNEEQKIVDWILFRAQRGLPVTKTELLDSVEQYVKLLKKETPFIDNRPSRHWYEGFRKRHPQLAIRKPQNLTHSRAAVTDDDLKDWFEEQGNLCPPSEKVLLDKGSRSAYKVVDSKRKVLLFYLCILLMVIVHHPCLCFLTRLKCRKNSKNCPEGWGVGLSDNGWMTAESFYEYITNVFYPGSLDTTSVITNITNVPTTTLTTPVMEKNSEPQINLTLSESVVSKENDSKSANEIETNVGNPFDQAFKMPTKYLPKKKRIKVESSRKPKLPSAGTSDQWMQYHSKKENDEIIKKKNKNEKQLQEQKNG